MKMNIDQIITALAKKFGNIRPALDRRYNFTLTLKRKKRDAAPLLRANFSGEVPKEWIAVLALIGLLTLTASIVKLIRLFHR